ncbi:MAG: glycosyltransferase family 4 protein [Chloroherpetonaceae bacterium]|nr:glycosyltransferase family 4 protein [Chloroherpetonaceae bacterium]
MKVILSHVARHHAYETAFALQEAGWLHRYYTSFYLEKNPALLHQLIRKILPQSLQKKSSNQYDERLNELLIRSYFFPELLERTPLRSIVGTYNMMNLKGELFNRRVAMQDLECDVFHGFEGAVLYSMRKAKKQGAKTVLDYPIFHFRTVREIMVEEYQRFGINPPTYLVKDDINIRRKQQEIEEADYVLVPTQRIAVDFVRYGKSPNQVIATPYGFSPGRFFVKEVEEKRFRILFVGIIGFRKGVYYLLEAFRQLQLKDAELILVSPVEEEFKPVLAKYEGLFRYTHSLPNDKLKDVYQSASVFVLPSLVEGSAYVTYEAMASGLPVIVSENAGSVARNGIDGFVVPIRSVEALKEKILLLYENEKLRREMGKSAAEHVKQFTWENYRRKLREFYCKNFGG